MSFLSAYEGTETVPIPHPEIDGYWVKLRKSLLRGETRKSAEALQEMEIVNGRPMPAPNVRKSQDEKLLASIVAWNIGDTPDSIPWPIDMKSIDRLPDPIVEMLIAKVEELNRPRTKEEQAQFPAAGNSGDPASGDAGTAEPVDVPAGAGAVEAAWPAA